MAVDQKTENSTKPVDTQEVLEVARRLATESLAPRAAHYDAAATHPVDSWRDVWREGLLAMGIPERLGGLGMDMLTYIQVIETLASGCTNTGMTVHMHSTVTRFIDALATEEQKALYFREIVEDGKLFGSWGSEPETRGGTALRLTTISPHDGGYVINGTKHFCTMSGGAHRYMIHCSSGADDPLESQWLALLPHGTPGIEQIGDWDTLGMRATVSPAMRLNDCFVGPDAPLGRPGEAPRPARALPKGLDWGLRRCISAWRRRPWTSPGSSPGHRLLPRTRHQSPPAWWCSAPSPRCPWPSRVPAG